MNQQQMLEALAKNAPTTVEAANYKAECNEKGWAVSIAVVHSLNKSGTPLPDHKHA